MDEGNIRIHVLKIWMRWLHLWKRMKLASTFRICCYAVVSHSHSHPITSHVDETILLIRKSAILTPKFRIYGWDRSAYMEDGEYHLAFRYFRADILSLQCNARYKVVLSDLKLMHKYSDILCRWLLQQRWICQRKSKYRWIGEGTLFP